MLILVLNAGSSTLKSALYRFDDDQPSLGWEGLVDWSGLIWKTTTYGDPAEPLRQKANFDQEHDRAVILSKLFGELDLSTVACVGHRVVHGGDRYASAVFLNPEVRQAIENLSSFAPIHNPAALEGIHLITAMLARQVPQVAVFDTAFHAQMPAPATIYPIPYGYFEQGIRRYGFHGTSHQYVAERAAAILGRELLDLKLITCHLGNGCSLAAIANGQSIDTTMGFTPLSGLMMGTRSGDIDPSILLHLGRTQGLSYQQLDDLLNRQSGLLGVSGISGDLRTVLQAKADGYDRAHLAYAVFIHRLRSCMGSMLASLGGIDAIVFTGGIGENSPLVRADSLLNFQFLGIQLDHQLNQATIASDQVITQPNSPKQVLVIHTQEDRTIAQACWQLLNNQR